MTDARPTLSLPDGAERDDLAAFTARVVRLDAAALIRLRSGQDRVVAWAPTPFEVLVTRSARGTLHPVDVTVSANELLAALAVGRRADIDPGTPADLHWRPELPPATGWRTVEEVPASELEKLAEQGIALARERGGATSALLDQTVLTVTDGQARVQVPLRCLFALSGMGFLGAEAAEDRVRVSVAGKGTDWMRLDARYGAVVRRHRPLLPLVF